MKTKITNFKRVDILGNGDCSPEREILTAILKRWRQRFAYFSIFAAVPAISASHISEARSDEAKKPEANVAGRGMRLLDWPNNSCSSPELLKRQSEFRLPHQKGNMALLAMVAGNDNCPGLRIPGGTYTVAAPYIDSGNTIGANDTVTQVYYYYYNYFDARGPDHVYSFILTDRGQNAQLQVSTSSSTYQPLVYVLQGFAGACPAGTGVTVSNGLYVSEATSPGGTATLDLEFVPLNVPLHLFIDARAAGVNSSGPYTLRMQDVTVSSSFCSNPIDCPEFFVYQHYIDFLFRGPDPPGFAAWLALLNNCPPGDTSCDRIHVSGAFFRSPEFQGRGYFLYRFYNVAFGRKPDFDEFAHDMGYVSGFLTDAQLEAQKIRFLADFMGRPAFKTKFNTLNNTQFVDTLLSEAGVTHPSRDSWIAALNNGSRARYEVMRELVESTQVYNKYYNQAFVVMQYFGYLKRQPDALYLNWLAYLEATGDYRNMINGFVNSLEYRNRFAP